MRTTIDLPDDLLAIARSLARGHKQTLSEAVAELMRRGIDPPKPAVLTRSPISGFPVLQTNGRTITNEDVRAMEDEEDEYVMSFMRSSGRK